MRRLRHHVRWHARTFTIYGLENPTFGLRAHKLYSHVDVRCFQWRFSGRFHECCLAIDLERHRHDHNLFHSSQHFSAANHPCNYDRRRSELCFHGGKWNSLCLWVKHTTDIPATRIYLTVTDLRPAFQQQSLYHYNPLIWVVYSDRHLLSFVDEVSSTFGATGLFSKHFQSDNAYVLSHNLPQMK